jgi:hypothetical protein
MSLSGILEQGTVDETVFDATIALEMPVYYTLNTQQQTC